MVRAYIQKLWSRKTIMQCMLEDSRKQGHPNIQCFDNICDWTKMNANQLLHKIHDRDGWRQYVVKA